MSIKSDKWIRRMAAEHGMIEPFEPGLVRHRMIIQGDGRAADLWHPVGTLRLNSYGYLERKVNDDKPFYKRWRSEHLLIWEAAHGPLEKGKAIVFRGFRIFRWTARCAEQQMTD